MLLIDDTDTGLSILMDDAFMFQTAKLIQCSDSELPIRPPTVL